MVRDLTEAMKSTINDPRIEDSPTHKAVVQAVACSGPTSGKELDRILNNKSAHKRCSELIKMGLLSYTKETTPAGGKLVELTCITAPISKVATNVVAPAEVTVVKGDASYLVAARPTDDQLIRCLPAIKQVRQILQSRKDPVAVDVTALTDWIDGLNRKNIIRIRPLNEIAGRVNKPREMFPVGEPDEEVPAL